MGVKVQSTLCRAPCPRLPFSGEQEEPVGLQWTRTGQAGLLAGLGVGVGRGKGRDPDGPTLGVCTCDLFKGNESYYHVPQEDKKDTNVTFHPSCSLEALFFIPNSLGWGLWSCRGQKSAVGLFVSWVAPHWHASECQLPLEGPGAARLCSVTQEEIQKRPLNSNTASLLAMPSPFRTGSLMFAMSPLPGYLWSRKLFIRRHLKPKFPFS